MAEYVMGSPTDPAGNGGRVKITDEDLAKHMLIVGGTQKGKTSMLKHLVNLHLELGRSFSLFENNNSFTTRYFSTSLEE